VKIYRERDGVNRWTNHAGGFKYLTRKPCVVWDRHRYYVYELEHGMCSLEFFSRSTNHAMWKIWVVGTNDEIDQLIVRRVQRRYGRDGAQPDDVFACSPGVLPRFEARILAYELERT
jgi:hypothetical protein